MASSSSSGAEDDFCVSARTPSHKKGPVYMAKLIKQHTKARTKLTVNFDSKGNPKGKNGTNWRSFLGMVARSRIPITFNDWRKVPDHYKVTLWRDATSTVSWTIHPHRPLCPGPYRPHNQLCPGPFVHTNHFV
ncbi:hypothetical protein QQ045_031920 [Rhodiola kirilowii]